MLLPLYEYDKEEGCYQDPNEEEHYFEQREKDTFSIYVDAGWKLQLHVCSSVEGF